MRKQIVTLKNREINQLTIKQDPACQEVIQSLKYFENFLNQFEDLTFGRDVIVCRRPLFSVNSVLSSLAFTVGSIISCCESGCLADANTLLRKYRDDLFFYLYLIVYDRNKYEESGSAIIKEMEKYIDSWSKNCLDNLQISVVLKTIAYFPEMRDTIKKYKLEIFFKSISKRLNNYVHSNGLNYYNRFIAVPGFSDVQKEMGLILTDMRYITVAFLFLLTLCSPIMIMSSDYVDSLELGFDPPENSQYWVAPFIEEFFKNNLNLIDRSCLDYLRENTSMEFEI